MKSVDERYADYLVWLDSVGLLGFACSPAEYEKINGNYSSPNDIEKIVSNNHKKKTRQMNIIDQLKRDEGCRLKPYKDSVGKLTIGIGRNLDDVGISQDEAEMLLQNDLAKVHAQLSEQLPWIADLDDARQGVLENMCFNLGIAGLLGFRNTLAHIKAGEYDQAAEGMLASKWAEQVGPRAQRLAIQMRTGEWQ